MCVSGCKAHALYTDNRLLMGTIVEVTSPDKRAAEIVFDEIARIEKLLSVFDPGSDISRLNRSGSVKASPETFFIVKRSIEFCHASGGAFDITVGPLVEAWGFKNNDFRQPPDTEISGILEKVGCDKIILIETDNVLQFKLPGVKINLGGIGKGFALDRAAIVLKKQKIHSCLINSGGQVYAVGDCFGKPWKIGIRGPRGEGIIRLFALKDGSVSTSADDQRFFIIGGRRYGHILDPRTGYPAQSGLISASVVASDGVTADALSTAVVVLGLKKGQELLQKFPGAELVSAVEEDTVEHLRSK